MESFYGLHWVPANNPPLPSLNPPTVKGDVVLPVLNQASIVDLSYVLPSAGWVGATESREWTMGCSVTPGQVDG